MILGHLGEAAVGGSSGAIVEGERAGKDAAKLTITRVNPLDHGEEIKQLFWAHDRPEFPDFFDRTYPDAVAQGAASWIGRDERGRMRAHIAQFPRRFLFGRHVVHGALLANLMVAERHRTFWPGLGLVRHMVKELRQIGSVDFLYADPNEPAQAIVRTAGFRPVGVLRRFVLPLADRRRGIDLGIRLYHLVGRLRARATPLVPIGRSAREAAEALDPVPAADARMLRPVRGASLYRSRLAGYPSASDCWYSVHARGSPDVRVGQALVRGPDRRGLAVLCALECEPVTVVSSLLLTLAQRLRKTGAMRLEVWAMVESQAAREIRRAGFVPRADRIPVLALPLTALGVEAVGPGADWRLLPVDLDR